MFKLVLVALPLLAQTVAAAPKAIGPDSGVCRAMNTTTRPSATVIQSAASPSGTATVSWGQNSTDHHNSTGYPPYNSTSGDKGLRNVLYFTNWGIYGANYTPQEIPADKITHLMYAFAGIAPDGSVVSSDTWADVQKPMAKRDQTGNGTDAFGSIQQLYLLKKKNRNMKTLLSIGGYTASQQGKFQPAMSTDAGRQLFASSAVKLLADWGFDGLDVDWEYPANQQEATDFVLLLKACREALDKYAKDNGQAYHYLLTATASAGPQHYNVQDLKAMDEHLDAWHLMAFDYAGDWCTVSGDQSNVYPDPDDMASTPFNTNQAVEDYIGRGISPDKIVLGLPLYGRSFMNTDGPGKPFSGVGEGSVENGVWLYRDLPRPGSTVHVDNETISAYSYDPATGELVSFDNVETARLKARYLMGKGLGGAFFWEASGDRTGEQSLVGTLAEAMGRLEDSKNMLEYPVSQYDNIRDGMPDA